MEYPKPVYQETKGIPYENLNKSIKNLRAYMQENMFLLPGGCDGAIIKFLGLTEKDSLVILSGLRDKELNWQNGFVTVINMNKDDSKLIKKLLEVADPRNSL